MTRELKRVSVVVFLMFATLFVSTTIIQFFQADNLSSDARNARTIYASYDTERGPILVDGQPIAVSVPTNDEFKYQRTYTNGPLYSAVTGYYTLGQGSSQIEQALNDYLSGTSDSQFLDYLNRLVTGQNPQGASVELTIDPVIQQAAYDALGDKQGAVVAIEPSTGRILAMVSKPDYDPNALAVHDSQQVLDTYDQLLAAPGDPLINKTINDLNPPGSTFKIVTTSAAVQNAGLDVNHTEPNPARLQLPGSSSTISNAGGGTCGGGDTVTIQTAFVLSCNIPMAELGMEMGETALGDMAKAFGFGSELSVPMDVSTSVFPRGLDDAQLALASFGQGSDVATPIQVAMLSAAVANGGKLMTPTLVDEIRAPDLSLLQGFEAKEFGTPLTSVTASTLSELMVEAVESGAATNARIDGVSVAGKTGTAENGEGDPYTLWFTGFAPADNPRIAVAVVVEDGGGMGQDGTGNELAAPIAKRVLEAGLSK
ncbi:penicillin-binding protein 2 [Herbiconiux sp. KACC 21604]|uniref:peptidoglycan D,D-transpeptidase FtsI family protein n=1 Tax=unclassified Herbiconiux TaxID=2618217 RepID=UPI0014924D77|nr:penicillin-binding protein 2 [Herbiconiux sp. SALV-R1]QJU55491.1 penicillin-binding protein 2 [Herbiconiux sp. SALV-R1]WPO86675.1 penicillin-binding protein 2 [Herbiconiux sp. KACC 21604]